MIRFHNRVVDSCRHRSRRLALRACPRARDEALPVDDSHRLPAADLRGAVVNDVFTNGRKAFEVGAAPTDVPTMPIEFSVAAYRLGHSMVRGSYNWNKIFDDGFGTLDLLFTFSATSGDLGGFLRLLSNWIADFRRLYDFAGAASADLGVPAAKFNQAMRIDTRIVDPLRSSAGRSAPRGPAETRANLAFRNLTRANMVRLATGQQMVTFLRSKGITSRSSPRRRSATETAVPISRASPRRSESAPRPTRRSGSTSCARPS